MDNETKQWIEQYALAMCDLAVENPNAENREQSWINYSEIRSNPLG